MKLNVNELRKLAGLPQLNEWSDSDDGDDGLSASERALASKADADLKKKGIKVANVDPEKDLEKVAKKSKPEAEDDEAPAKPAAKPAAKAEPKAEPKKEEKPAAKVEPKKDETPAEAKRRGKAPNPDGKSGKARAWFANHPSPTRGEFMKYAKEHLDMGSHYASAYFQRMKGKKVAATESDQMWLLFHPSASNFILAENREMNQYQWTDGTNDNLTPLVFESEAATAKLVEYMGSIKNQYPRVEMYDVDAE